MLSLLKKLFGSKPAEQPAKVPYKVEVAPVVDLAKVEVVTAAPTPAPVAKSQPKKKPAGQKPAGPKPAQKQTAPKQGAAKKGGRRPKSKPQV